MGITGLAMALAAAQEDGACGRAVARPDHDFLARLTAIADTLPGVDVRVRSRVVGVERERYGDEDGDDDGDGSGAGKRDTWALRLEDTTPSLGRRHGRDVGSEAELFDFVIMAAPGLEGTVYQQRVRASNSTSESTSNKDNVEAEDAVDFASAHLMFVTRTSRLADPVPGAGGDGDEASLPPQFLFIDDNDNGNDNGGVDAQGVRGVEYVRDVVRYADGDATGRIEHLYRYITDKDISGLLATDPAVTWMYHHRVSVARISFYLTFPLCSIPFSLYSRSQCADEMIPNLPGEHRAARPRISPTLPTDDVSAVRGRRRVVDDGRDPQYREHSRPELVGWPDRGPEGCRVRKGSSVRGPVEAKWHA